MLDNKQIRKKIKIKRLELDEAIYQSKSLSIYQHIKKWDVYQQAKRIGLYMSLNHEVSTLEIIKDALENDKVVLLPKTFGKHEMSFYEIKSLGQLKEGDYHILEPDASCKQSDHMDLLLMPLVGYNHRGYRLGMGGGYYDFYLSHHSLITCGLAFKFQETEFEVFQHDCQMNYLMNEDGLLCY